jgi:hypothetical protein
MFSVADTNVARVFLMAFVFNNLLRRGRSPRAYPYTNPATLSKNSRTAGTLP